MKKQNPSGSLKELALGILQLRADINPGLNVSECINYINDGAPRLIKKELKPRNYPKNRKPRKI